MASKPEEPTKKDLAVKAEEMEEELDATWSEVFDACCVHDAGTWVMILAGIIGCLFFLYFFLFGLDLLGTGAKVMAGCRAGALFGDDTNPIAGLMVGILATVLLQSSSTTTSIVVSLVPAVVSARQGIFMIMGANIGTSVTNTIVAMGQMGDADQLERAFSGATVHDCFNILSVAILLPVEIVTRYLYALTKAMVRNVSVKDGENWEGPVKKLVDPLGAKIITDNSSFIKNIAKGKASCENDAEDSPYPIKCEEGVPMNKNSCPSGLMKCGDDGCPAFYQDGAEAKDHKIAGGVCFFLGIVVIFICMFGLVTILQKMLLGVSSRIIYKATAVNGYLGILIGAGITMVVQSSSITTSILTPFVGLGAIRLEQMFPMTLGANLGTTLTALLASLVSDSVLSLQVALAHLMFNVTGTLIWYPVPFMRNIPLGMSRRLGKVTRMWRGFPFVYILVVFLGLPLVFLGISLLFTQDSAGFTVLGVFIVIGIVAGIAYTFYYMHFRGGYETCLASFEAREARRSAMETLPNDMGFLKRNMKAVMDQMGLEDDEAPADVDGAEADVVYEKTTKTDNDDVEDEAMA